MRHVSIQSRAELEHNLSAYEKLHTNGREPDKDQVSENYINRIKAELAAREEAAILFGGKP